MKKFRVLHLSDIHIGDTYMESKELAYRVISDIESENLHDINCVIVTGDIFEGRLGFNEELINEAVNFFNIIYEELKKTTNLEKTDFLFVPGNHDILRDQKEENRWGKYGAFLTKFYDSIPDFYFKDFSLLKKYDDSKIAFVGFNSCGLKEELQFDAKLSENMKQIADTDFETSGLSKKQVLDFINKHSNTKTLIDFGEIQTKQILEIKRELKNYDDYNIVAFFHHHFYLFPEVYSKYGDSSLIRNYTEVIRNIQQVGVKTVLHGHKHFDLERPMISDSYYDNPNNIINIIAGGSVGTSRTTRHTFNIIDFFDKDDDFKLVQRKFVYNNDRLEPINVKHIPPEAKENNAKITLLKVFKDNDPDLFDKYNKAIDKINIAADDYTNMIMWLENIFIGFNEIHKIFESNPLCVFFLLFAMNYRVLKMKQILGKERIDKSYYEILNSLLKDTIPDVGFDKEQYLKIFENDDLDTLKQKCDQILETISQRKSKFYLSFSMIGIFITDMYLMLRYYAGSFYNKYIQYKVNINLNETEFHQDVPVQKIAIHSDADRRSAFIDLRCNSATAHKLAVLFVKEFELIISKFEDYFKIVGLKLYYICPKIEKNALSAIDNYNFEAYIPTLIPLLTGDKIYAQKEVFARELIQNSIDAIAVRASKDKDVDNFDKKIYITLGESNGRKFFRIKDYGTGMDRFKIERYFTSIGRSFYSGKEYKELEIDYKPISNFGIGFLSAFMICREIDVKTKYYLDEQEGLKLHIPNYDGCFFIEKDESLDIGTEITLYIDKDISHDINLKTITSYITDTMQDINCTIEIRNEVNKKTTVLESRQIRKNVDAKDILFVPFSDSGNVIDGIDVEKTIWSKKFIDDYQYGLIINLDVTKSSAGRVLNSGIKLNDTSVNDIWKMLLKGKVPRNHIQEIFFTFNFPSNFLNVDVSREKIVEFAHSVIEKDFKNKLMTEIINQILQYIELSKTAEINNVAINLHYFMAALLNLCGQDQTLKNLVNLIGINRYEIYVQFNTNSIELIVSRNCNKPVNSIALDKKCNELFSKFVSNNKIEDVLKTNCFDNEYLYRLMRYSGEYIHRSNILDDSRKFYENDVIRYLNGYLFKKFEFKEDKLTNTYLILSYFLTKNEYERYQDVVKDLILTKLLNSFTVSQIEKGESCIVLGCEDIEKLLEGMNKKK